jgi:hypothetical protein
MDRSSSKVTINVRQTQTTSSAEDSKVSNESKADAMEDGNPQPPPAVHTPRTPPSSPPARPIEAISPSSRGSPEIEVADVEDINGDDINSTWTQLMPGDDDIEALLEAFPAAGITRANLGAGPHNMLIFFEKGKARNQDESKSITDNQNSWRAQVLGHGGTRIMASFICQTHFAQSSTMVLYYQGSRRLLDLVFESNGHLDAEAVSGKAVREMLLADITLGKGFSNMKASEAVRLERTKSSTNYSKILPFS